MQWLDVTEINTHALKFDIRYCVILPLSNIT